MQKTRLKKAWSTKLVNKRDISSTSKVILCLDRNPEWIEKDTTSNWCFKSLRDINPFTKKPLDFFTTFFSIWLGEKALDNFKNLCTLRDIPFWSDCSELSD